MEIRKDEPCPNCGKELKIKETLLSITMAYCLSCDLYFFLDADFIKELQNERTNK